jgi:S1-C subfamily serine protease
VARVGEDSRLFKAGLRAGDRLLAVNGQPVASDGDLRPLLGNEAIQLSIDRPRKIRPLTMKVPAQ